jgi:hypothetical protein
MDRMIEARKDQNNEYWNRPYKMRRRAMGKAEGMVAGLLHSGDEAGELENKLLRSWEGPRNALACWCEERMQDADYERDVPKVRRCIHSINGRGLVRVSDGGYGFLAVKPAFLQREDISFFMGVTASAGWPAGVYRGVVVEGKGELRI